MDEGDTAAMHCSNAGPDAWGDVLLTRHASTGLYAPPHDMAAGDYEGLLRIKRGGGGGGGGRESWLPIPLAGLRPGSDGSTKNRCWTILPAA